MAGMINSVDHVVTVEHLCKSYNKANPILQNVCMHVAKGSVYALLGSSGCGKTTLLSCILGLKEWESGSVCLLGQEICSGSNGSGGLSRKIGYTPQQLALCSRLTVTELLHCFGGLYGMSSEAIASESKVLFDLLDLKHVKSQLICNLSGGEQRRVSLALAFMHKPELAILDEPTVGLDPLLRISVWEHIYKMTATGKMTILLTTHYIEEVRKANMVGVMRNGRLIAEQNPETLINSFGTHLLDDAVYQLCKRDHQQQIVLQEQLKNPQQVPTVSTDPGIPVTNFSKPTIKVGVNNNNTTQTSKENFKDSLTRTVAYARVIGLSLIRQPVLVGLVFLLPILQLTSILSVVGTEPKNVPMALINNDFLNFSASSECERLDDVCPLSQFGCQFIQQLSEGGIITPIGMNSVEEALTEIRQGNVRGYISIPANYSQHLLDRVLLKLYATNETIDGTVVTMQMDMSDSITTSVVLEKFRKSFIDLINNVEKLCSYDLSSFKIPIVMREPPVYGQVDSTPRDYAMAVMIVSIILQTSFLTTPWVLLDEFKNGTLERAQVAGLRVGEALTGILVVIMTAVIVQSVISYLCLMFPLHFQVYGTFICYFVVSLIGTLCSISWGLLLGLIVKDVMSCIMVTIILVPIFTFYQGMFGPMEAIPYNVRVASYYTPMVAIIEPMRAVLNRGLTLTHPTAWPGLLLQMGWTVAAILACYAFRKRLFS